MNKRGKIVTTFVIFIVAVLVVFILETKEIKSQISEETNQPTKAKIGFGGGWLSPKQSQKPEVVPQNNITLNLLINQSEKAEADIQKQYIDPEILEELSKSSEVSVIVKIRDTSGISISAKDTIEEQATKDLRRNEFFGNKTNSVLSTLPSNKFKLKGKFLLGNGFYGNVTKEGFEKLINNSNVGEIYLEIIAHVLLDKSRLLINADDVENVGYTGLYQTACVLDIGIDYHHSALGGCLGSGCKVRGGWDYYNNDGDPDDDEGHGTNIAGIIASTNTTYKGMAPNARLVAMKVCNATPTGTSCPSPFIVNALQYCYINRNIYNISVVSISIGDGGEYPPNCPSTAKAEINDLYSVGIPVVIASGNNGHTNGISWPACTPNATSVGAVYDENLGREPDTLEFQPANCHDDNAQVDNITCFSNRKVGVLDLLAPGCRINSTKINGGFSYMCGTSQAAPHVSGTVLLLKQLNKTLTPSQIESTLKNTGVNVGSYKRIDALAALNAIRDKDSDGYYDEAYGGDDCNDNNAAINPGATEVCDDIDNDCDDIIDEGCVEECTESGYEQCAESSYGDCDVSIAVNYYTNVNTIKWGAVNDASDPYVINEYKVGWKAVDAEQMYYDVNDPNNDCYYGGCDGEEISSTGTKVTVTAPGTATTKNILGYDDTASYACWVWFNGFNPNYGANNPIYVLKCFNDNDCASGSYCNKTGSWNQWACVTKYANGQSCTQDSECQSSYCDNDGVGLSDDNWCFTPYNTYFDGQENTYCEYSTDNGIADCDERQVGTDLNKCVGTTYYEDECSSTCNYQDITSVFECTETGCSCSQPLCDGLTTGSNINTCSSGQTYFADKCTSTAGGEDRGDNICRSSIFASGCTANAQCNSVTAGTGNCDASCNYISDTTPPYITIIHPVNNTEYLTTSIDLNWTANEPLDWAAYSLDGTANNTEIFVKGESIYDDFNDNSIDASKWSTTTTGDCGGVMEVYEAGDDIAMHATCPIQDKNNYAVVVGQEDMYDLNYESIYLNETFRKVSNGYQRIWITN